MGVLGDPAQARIRRTGDHGLSYHEPGPTDALDARALVVSCIEGGSSAILLDAAALPPEFFDLSTRVAGELLHQLGKYGLRLAAVLADPTAHSGPFQAFVVEANRGGRVRFFPTRDEAILWLEEEC